jgi:vitamin B12/bleomycin/antimicrobial peptide transport system ATP-binding/permease protein
MKTLGVGVALFGVIALVQPVINMDRSGAFLGGIALISAITTYRSALISSFVKIFIWVFSAETIVLGLAVVAGRAGLWPAGYESYLPPASLPLATAIFSTAIYLTAQLQAVKKIVQIADRYFNAQDTARPHVWPFSLFTAPERRIAVGLIAGLILVTQAEVGVLVRLSYFTSAFFTALQMNDPSAFSYQLLFVFVPWASIYVVLMTLDFFARSMLQVRWRQWLTDYFVSRWLARHNHYRIGLLAKDTDNPDQRIAEDVYRFINGGSDGSTTGYGVYDFSIQLVYNVNMLVAFAIVLWDLSNSFTVPGTDIVIPGFLFWVALIYAGAGTLITHLLGRPLIRLYYQRQNMEADFRFTLARLREYSEQIALLGGETAEQNVVRGRFGSLMDNWVAVIYRLVRVTAFTQAFNQVSTVIPYLFTAPYFFAGKIELGVMMQSAGAFMQVAGALTFFVTSYVFLAAFKSVVDRLNTFDAAIDKAQALTNSGPARVADPSGTPATAFEDIDISLPDGKRVLHNKDLVLACGQSVALSGPSGCGKSQLFRAIAGIWPFGEGRIRSPDGAHVMVVPAKPFIPNGTLRAGISFPAVTGTYSDDEIRSALADTHLGHLADQLDREDMWTQRLSTGEQQRLALTGALLMRPQWLFLDEATSALDEKMECELYAVLARRLPNTTIVSISHRTTCVVLHQRHIEMTPQGDHYTLRDVAKAAAAAE